MHYPFTAQTPIDIIVNTQQQLFSNLNFKDTFMPESDLQLNGGVMLISENELVKFKYRE